MTVLDRTLIGEVLFYNEQAHLKLMKVRDEDAWLGIYDGDAHSVSDLDLPKNNQLYETSIVSFLSYGNVVGMIQGSTSAPTPSALSQWINGLHIFGEDIVVGTQAVVSREAMRQLSQSSEASRIETKVSTNNAAALEARGSRLSGVLRRVSEEFGPVTVTLILQTSKARGNTEGRQIMRDEAENLAAAAGENEVDSARAKLIYYENDERSKARDVDFVKQRITAKRRIDTTSADGSPIRNVSAVQAIMEVAAAHEADLRAAVGA
ncbi:hypothetical protein [Rhodococcus pyridinivorans]|uniref:hypothetical protein n=1 Tax=Rhodococcus pyridinivorans TaxID=103816 RepID=UPI0013A6E379|nr:hypothetical protein [Rhodococcus pyridinivorans]